jgi:hypothetical protein
MRVDTVVRAESISKSLTAWGVMRLAAHGVPTDAKVVPSGFSSSGTFAVRLALVYPERVLAVAAGAPGAAVPSDDMPERPNRGPSGRSSELPVTRPGLRVCRRR